MANPFDQFDAPAAPSAPSGASPGPAPGNSGGNVFDQFDAPSATLAQPGSPKPSLMTAAAQPFAGFNEALADTVGAPWDATNWAAKKLGFGGSDKPVMGSQWIKDKVLGSIGANPDTLPAQTPAERVLRGAGAGAASVIAPEAALAGGVRMGVAEVAPRVVDALQSGFGSAASLPAVATNAAVGAASGAGAQVGSEIAPDGYKGYGALAGGLIGGGLGAGAAAVPMGVKAGVDAAKGYVAPMTQAGQEALARAKLQAAASDPSAVRSALEDGSQQLVPGSQPTTFQATGDMGLGSLERSVASQNPEMFQTRRAEQNAARSDALGGIQPSGDALDVSGALKSHLAKIDSDAAAHETAARSLADGLASQFGDVGTPEQVGNALRSSLQDARDAAKTNERGLWNAVDPDNSLAMSAEPITAAAHSIAGGMAKSAAPMSGEEAAIFDLARGYPAVQPFNEITALRSRLSTAMRDEMIASGQSPSYARMTQLRGAVEDAIHDAVTNKAAQEQAAVSAGLMNPEDTVAASLQRQVDAYYANKDASRASGVGFAQGAGAGSAGASGSSRAAGAVGRRLPTATSAEAVPPETPLRPNFDAAAADRLTAATQATKARAQTFDQGPVGTVLRSQGSAGQYRILDSKVPGTIFKPGPDGFQTASAYLKAAGDQGEALTNLHDAAALSFSRAAMKNGVVDQGAADKWIAQHGDALRAMPGIAPKFSDAARAAESVANLAAARRQAIDDAQRGAVGKLIGASDPSEVTQQVGGIFGKRDAVTQMRALAGRVGSDPDARAGLRKAVADYMIGKLTSNTEAATSGRELLKADQFQTFVGKNRATLAQVFDEEELNTLQAIAADLKRSNRSLTAVKIPGQSNTVQDLAAAAKHGDGGHGTSLMAKVLGAGGAGFAAHGLEGALTGAGAALGQHVIGGMRQAGMQKVSDLVRDAMLDPELARTLLMKAPIKPGVGSAVTLAHQLRRVAALATINSTHAVNDAHVMGGAN